MLLDGLPEELYVICTLLGDNFARINVLTRSLIHLLNRNLYHTRPVWDEFHQTIVSCLEHTENMLRSALSAAQGLEAALISHSHAVHEDTLKRVEAALQSLESARVSAQEARGRVLPAVKHAARCTMSCFAKRYMQNYTYWLNLMTGGGKADGYSPHDTILQLYQQLDTELQQLDNRLGVFKSRVLKDLAHLAQIVVFTKVTCDDDLHRCQTMDRTISNMLEELTSGIMWLLRQSSDFVQLRHAEHYVSTPSWDFNEQSLNDWAGVNTHKKYHLHSCMGSQMLFPKLLEELLYFRNSIAYYEYSGLLTAALSIAAPIRSGLRSAFIIEDGSFAYDSLLEVFGEACPLPMYDLTDQIGPSRQRKALVNFDFGLRRNIRYLNYWREHIIRISNEFKAKSGSSRVPLGFLPTGALFAAFSILVQVVALCLCYFLQERQTIFAWVVQYVVLAISYLVSLFDIFGSTRWLEGLLTLASLVTTIWAVSRLYILLTGFAVGHITIQIVSKALVHLLLCSQPFPNNGKDIVATLRLLALQLQEISYALREMQDAVDSISKPYLPCRLGPDLRHHIFVTFFSEHIGANAHSRKWHFGGLTPFVKATRETYAGSMANLKHCPNTHPDIWIQSSIPGRNCRLCARRRRPLMRSSVDDEVDENGRYLAPNKLFKVS